jgi:hypothetical protein
VSTSPLSTLLPRLIDAINAPAILRDIAVYWGFRSTVPGPGLTAASEFLARRHRENGVQAEIHAYPADNATPSLDGHKHPLAWFPRTARLEIAAPTEHARLICDFAREPLCLISNSEGHYPEGVTAEVVVIPNATTPEAYTGRDVRGKLVFTDVWPLLADAQARAHGALGLLTDSVTPPWLYDHPPVRRGADVPDLTMWGILNGHRCDHSLFGFSLTPRQGAHLRQAIAEAGDPLRLRVTLEAALAPGVSPLVTATIPGSDLAEEEIWMLSHSSEPGALDDASGCCASIEIGRALRALITSGALPPPRRTIRFLSAVETEGYLPYLHQLEDFGHIKAALAFDAVGADFRQTGGRFCLNRSPDYNPSFADDLLEAITAAVAAEPNARFTPDNYDIFPWQVEPCFPGNDNMLADGFFNIPTPMLTCWPDKFYHSSQDTPDKVSVGSLARAAAIGAAYVYLLAAAGLEEARWMADLTLRGWQHRVLDGAPAWQGIDALASLLRLEPSLADEVAGKIGAISSFAQAVSPSTDMATSAIKPTQWKPPRPEQLSPEGLRQLTALQKEYHQVDEAWWLLNGLRDVAAIGERTDLPMTAVRQYVALLAQEGFIRIEKNRMTR